METKKVTQKRLKELLHYDPLTGIFTHLTSRGGAKAGDIAGCVDGRGYIQIYVDRRNYRAHILAWLYIKGFYSGKCLDHVNRIRTDNRWVNIREASFHENNCNQSLRSDNTSGIKGVSWDRLNNKWRVEISTRLGRIRVGRFADIELAELVACEARSKYHGDFAV